MSAYATRIIHKIHEFSLVLSICAVCSVRKPSVMYFLGIAAVMIVTRACMYLTYLCACYMALSRILTLKSNTKIKLLFSGLRIASISTGCRRSGQRSHCKCRPCVNTYRARDTSSLVLYSACHTIYVCTRYKQEPYKLMIPPAQVTPSPRSATSPLVRLSQEIRRKVEGSRGLSRRQGRARKRRP